MNHTIIEENSMLGAYNWKISQGTRRKTDYKAMLSHNMQNQPPKFHLRFF